MRNIPRLWGCTEGRPIIADLLVRRGKPNLLASEDTFARTAAFCYPSLQTPPPPAPLTTRLGADPTGDTITPNLYGSPELEQAWVTFDTRTVAPQVPTHLPYGVWRSIPMEMEESLLMYLYCPSSPRDFLAHALAIQLPPRADPHTAPAPTTVSEDAPASFIPPDN